MENWDDLRFVVALARFGSMAQAARQLRTNTATVSRRIKRINENSDSVLFIKGATEWELTPDGRRIYELAAGFGEDLQALTTKNAAYSEQKQTVKVSAIEFLVSSMLAPALDIMQENHPNISVELSASDRKASLAYGEADIALRLARPTEGRLVAKKLSNMEIGPYAGEIKAKDAWIGLSYELDWTPEMRNATAFFGCEPVYRVASFRAILAAMQSTGLPGLCPSFMVKDFPQFSRLQPKLENCRREVWLLIHETKKGNTAIRDTCQWIEDVILSH